MELAQLWSALSIALLLASTTKVTGDDCGLLAHDRFVLFSKRVVTPNGVVSASVEVEKGKIISVTELSSAPASSENAFVMDYGNAVIMPGLVDIHVHLNEPGREDWEGFWTGTSAAAAGGLTTIVDMPLNSFPTTTSAEHFQMKVASTAGKLAVDVGFWGGLVPENAANLTALSELLDAGVLGLKSFMCPSGINDFPMTTLEHIELALPVLAKYRRPLLVHAEVPQPADSDSNVALCITENQDYSTYLNSRPPSWEQAAIKQLVSAARNAAEGARIHVVHLSDASESLQLLKNAKAEGLNISVETCTHYLSFSSDDVKRGDTRFKCAPPIRSEANRQRLWDAVKDGFIDLLSSDHSPAPPEMKQLDEGDFMAAWGGISSLQLGLPATWTYGREHGMTLHKISELWSTGPAALANLDWKGSIEVNKDADFVVWDPESSFLVDQDFTLYHKHKVTPYADRNLYGRVISTFVRGQQVFQEGHLASDRCGRTILAFK